MPDLSMTSVEVMALAPVIAALHPADLESILDLHRAYGHAARACRQNGETTHPYQFTPAAWAANRPEVAKLGALRLAIRDPRSDEDERFAYGETMLVATEALRFVYLEDPDRADAALDALNRMIAA